MCTRRNDKLLTLSKKCHEENRDCRMSLPQKFSMGNSYHILLHNAHFTVENLFHTFDSKYLYLSIQNPNNYLTWHNLQRWEARILFFHYIEKLYLERKYRYRSQAAQSPTAQSPGYINQIKRYYDWLKIECEVWLCRGYNYKHIFLKNDQIKHFDE